MLWQHNLLQDYCSNSLQTWNMVPTGTGNQGKPGKMGRHFPVREKSGNFVKTGKNYTGKLKRILEKSGKFVSQ